MMKLIEIMSILIWCFVLLNGLLNVNCSFNSELYNKFPNDLRVWLTINADVKLFDNPFKAIVRSQRLFELNYIFKDNSSDFDWIGLFNRKLDPNVSLI